MSIKKQLSLWLCLGLLLWPLPKTVGAASLKNLLTTESAAHHILVSPEDGVSLNDLRLTGVELGETNIYSVPTMWWQKKSLLHRLHNDTRVAIAEADYVRKATLTPNDTRFIDQYHLPTINAPRAWDIATGRQEDIIAIIDTGIDYQHEDLAARLWSNSKETADNGLDDDGNGLIDDIRGWDFVNNDNNPLDDQGHGTAVAGLAAAVSNNNNGIAGASFGPRIMNLKALNSSGLGFDSNIISAIEYAKNKGARIINLSFGSSNMSAALKQAMDSALANNMVIVASSGNSGSDDIEYPARYEPVIAVGSSNKKDERASFSNAGLELDVIAPGESLVTTAKGGGYGSATGTSGSAPLVSSLAALLIQQSPSLTPLEIQSTIRNGATKVPGMNGEEFRREFGYGRVDFLATLTGSSRFAADQIGIDRLEADGRVHISSNDTATVTITFKNTGKATWYREGSSPVRLATTPLGRSSLFFPSNSTPGILNESEVKPGGQGTITVTLQAPTVARLETETLRLHLPGIGFFGPDITLPIETNPATAKLIAKSPTGGDGKYHLQVGQPLPLFIQLQNTGGGRWHKNSGSAIRLGTSQPFDRISSLIGSSNRTQTFNETSVGQGEIAAFEFHLIGQAKPGIYEEILQPVAEGISWLAEPIRLPMIVHEHHSTLISQSAGLPGNPIRVKQGETVTIWAQFKNTGLTTWYKGGLFPIALGTASPRDRLSPFLGLTHRGPTVNEPEVPTGQLGAFEFTLKADVLPGRYQESFQMVAERSHWFGQTVTFEIVVE